MSRTISELLIIFSTTFFLSVLLFLSGPLRKVVNAMDSSTSRQFIYLLFDVGKRSPFLLLVTNLPVLGSIPYFVTFGFNNWWMISGLILFTAAASVAKVVKLPIYKAASTSLMGEAEWRNALRKMNTANALQAASTSIAVCLMVAGLFLS